MAKKGVKKKAAKRKVATRKPVKRKAVTRKAVTLKAAKRKKPRKPVRKPARKPQPVIWPEPETIASKTITLGCEGSDCVPDEDPFVTKAGETFQLCAPKNDVRIHFTTRPSPLIPSTDPLFIRKGTCITVTVSGNASGSYRYHVTCSNPGCGNLSADPEMIVQ